MRKCAKQCLFGVVLSMLASASVHADLVKSLDFTGTTRTERVVIEIDETKQVIEYSTPSKDYNYQILDYDYSVDPSSGSRVFTGTVVDTRYNTASEVILYSNDKYADMRIGKKQLTFNYVEEFKIQSW